MLGQRADVAARRPRDGGLSGDTRRVSLETSSGMRCSLPPLPCSSRRRCTPKCGFTRRLRQTSRSCVHEGCTSSIPRTVDSRAPTRGPAGSPEPEQFIEALYAGLHDRAVAEGQGLAEHPSAIVGGWGDMDGMSVVVTAGGTHEPIDAVRFLGNRSTGHQGFALAEAARERGAHVTVVAANVALPLGEGVDRVDVSTGAELEHAVSLHADGADVVVMAAAVADYRPRDLFGVQAQEARRASDARAGGDGRTSWPASFATIAGPDGRGFRGRNRRRRRDVRSTRGREGETQGGGSARGQSRRRSRSSATSATRSCWFPRGAVVAEVSGSKLAVAHGLWDAVVALRS